MAFKFLSFLLLAGAEAHGGPTYLTNETWEQMTIGKKVFVNFCKNDDMQCIHLHEFWDRVAHEYDGHDDVLLASVDCKFAGRSLCDRFAIHAYPTIVYGAWDELVVYKGAQSSYTGHSTQLMSHYAFLKHFVDTELAAHCDPEHLDVCDERERPLVEKYMGMEQEDLHILHRDTVDKVSVDIPLMKKVVAFHKHEPKEKALNAEL